MRDSDKVALIILLGIIILFGAKFTIECKNIENDHSSSLSREATHNQNTPFDEIDIDMMMASYRWGYIQGVLYVQDEWLKAEEGGYCPLQEFECKFEEDSIWYRNRLKEWNHYD